MARYKRLVAQMVNSEPKHAVMLQTVKADQVADTAEVSADKRKDKLDEVQSEEWDEIVSLVDKNLEHSVAPSTSTQYKYWWRRFQCFCSKFKLEATPFTEFTCIAFLSDTAENSKGVGGVDQARAALKHFHMMSCPDSESPTDSLRVTAVIKGIKRRFQRPVQKKRPIATKDFEKLLISATDKGNYKNVKLVDLRFAAQISVMFCTFSRYEESCALRVSDLMEEEEGMVVKFPKGKQYQFGEAREGVMLNQPDLVVNPVEVLKKYVSELSTVGNSTSLLFPSFRYVGHKLVSLQGAASYDCVLKQFKTLAKKAGIAGKPEDYGLHSFRRGAVTTAVNNGCDEHTVMKQMRVASTNTVARYATLDRKRLGKANQMLFK